MPASRLARIALLAAALAAALVLLFPLYWIVLTSILPTRITLSRTPPLLPPLDEVTLAAYPAVFGRKPLLTWLPRLGCTRSPRYRVISAWRNASPTVSAVVRMINGNPPSSTSIGIARCTRISKGSTI